MNTIRRIGSPLACLMLAAWMLSSTGCKAPWSEDWKYSDMFDLKKGMPWEEDGPKKGTPTRLVCTWTDTVLQQSGKTPQRGFGARIIFYEKDKKEPILVDGQLVVYAFDEMNRDPTDNRPTRRYVFPADQVSLHMSKTELGASYSFWLPWDDAGGPQTEVSLIPRFEPKKKGAVVVGEQARQTLPGSLPAGSIAKDGTKAPKLPEGIPARPARAELSTAPGGPNDMSKQVQLASYEGAAAGDANSDPSQRRMMTTSITLPDNFRVNGAQAPPSAPRAAIQAMPAPTAKQPLFAPPSSPAAPAGYGAYAPVPGAGAVRMAQQQAPIQPSAALFANPQGQAYPGYAAPPASMMGSGFPPPGMMGQSPVAQAPQIPGPQMQQMQPVNQGIQPIGPGSQQAINSANQQLVGNNLPQATGVTTSVSYLSPADSARFGIHPPQSAGYPPQTPQAPASPVVQ